MCIHSNFRPQGRNGVEFSQVKVLNDSADVYTPGAKLLIHVDPDIMRANEANRTNNPPVTVRDFATNEVLAQGVAADIQGASTIVYQPDVPRQTGQIAFLLTAARVRVYN